MNRFDAVHQFHSGTGVGDAVTNQMLELQANVRELGFSLGYGAGRRSSSLMLAQRIRPLPPSK